MYTLIQEMVDLKAQDDEITRKLINNEILHINQNTEWPGWWLTQLEILYDHWCEIEFAL